MDRLLALLVALVGCKGKPNPDARLVRENLLDEAPALARSIKADLGGGVVYLGNELDADRARPGGSVTVTHYIKVNRPHENGANLVVELVGDDDKTPPAVQPPSPMQRAYPARKWETGEIIRDRQVVEVPADWPEETAAIEVGLGPVKAKVGRVPIERGREYAVHRAEKPIVLDGVPEPTWREAAWSPRFTTAEGGRAVRGEARAKLLWDDAHLYVLVEVVDPQIFSPYTGRDDTLWKADVVEIFIDADRNRRGYVELQANPRGAIFDAFFPVTRAQESHFEWSSGMKTGVAVDGAADKKGSRDRGWVVEMAIPHRDVKGMAEDMAVEIPPKVGDRWNLNVVRVDQPGGKGTSAATWNPITIRDFHAVSRMLTVVFAD